MNLRIELASPEQRWLTRGLLTDCLKELSQYGATDVSYPYFEAYWDTEAHRWPYLILLGLEKVGFALVNTWSPSGKGTDFAMAEFYIVPKARRAGVGSEAAKGVLQMHVGIWELGIMPSNASAKRFWPKVIEASEASAVEQIETDDETVYRFIIASAAKSTTLSDHACFSDLCDVGK